MKNQKKAESLEKRVGKVENSALESIVEGISRGPGRPQSPAVEGILPEHRKEGMELLLIAIKKGCFGKKKTNYDERGGRLDSGKRSFS